MMANWEAQEVQTCSLQPRHVIRHTSTQLKFRSIYCIKTFEHIIIITIRLASLRPRDTYTYLIRTPNQCPSRKRRKSRRERANFGAGTASGSARHNIMAKLPQ
jgi:hypothetical protein